MLAERIDAYIQEHRLIGPKETVVIGFSGGPDSLCLAHILKRLSGRHGWQLILAHFDHQLRGEASAEDAEFCRQWAEEAGIPIYSAARDIAREARASGESTEVAARKHRYAYFKQVMEATEAHRIALGHHQDDQAETVLMRLIRGTGTDGLAGMRAGRSDGVIRPLLGSSRQEILAYCNTHKLNPRIDHTNLQDVYTRNALRLEVLPLLAERYNPRIREALCRMAALAAEDSDCLNAMASETLAASMVYRGSTLEIPLEVLKGHPPAVVKRMIRQGVRQVAGSAENLEADHLHQVLSLVQRGLTGKQAVFCGVRFVVNYGRLTLAPEKIQPLAESTEVILEPGTVNVFGGRFTLRRMTAEAGGQWDREDRNRIIIDAGAVKGTLRIRQRKPGDRMIPLGMQDEKKLKALMIDAKIPRDSRDRVPVLVDDEKILWLAGVRMDERVRVRNTTKDLLEICWEVCCSPE